MLTTWWQHSTGLRLPWLQAVLVCLWAVGVLQGLVSFEVRVHVKTVLSSQACQMLYLQLRLVRQPCPEVTATATSGVYPSR